MRSTPTIVKILGIFLGVSGLALGLFLLGVGVGSNQLFGPARAPVDPSGPGAKGRWHEAREGLATLPYLSGYNPPSDASGVVVHDAEAASAGLTLFSSGHQPVVQLIDMDGEVVHQWRVRFDQIWPEGVPFGSSKEHQQFIRRAHLFPNGELLIVFEYIGIAKLDKNSKVLWKIANQAHHDIEVTPEGVILVPTRDTLSPDEANARYPGLGMIRSLDDERITSISPDGETLDSISLTDAFQGSEFAPYLDVHPARADPYHLNSIDYVEETGDLLVSIRNLNLLALLDGESGLVKWLGSGKWRQQHQAERLVNGNILLLDNRGGNSEAPFRANQSRAIEFDPSTLTTAWQYGGSEADPLFSSYLGYVQRLPNGNTLITESTQGRILEVTAEGNVAWEYRSPLRAGVDDELIATIMGAQRVDPATLTFLSE